MIPTLGPTRALPACACPLLARHSTASSTAAAPSSRPTPSRRGSVLSAAAAAVLTEQPPSGSPTLSRRGSALSAAAAALTVRAAESCRSLEGPGVARDIRAVLEHCANATPAPAEEPAEESTEEWRPEGERAEGWTAAQLEGFAASRRGAVHRATVGKLDTQGSIRLAQRHRRAGACAAGKRSPRGAGSFGASCCASNSQ